MVNGHAASHVDYSQDRPKFIRYNSDPSSCHPLQRKRSSLGDTHGAVYIPVRDRKHVLWNQHKKYAHSVPTSPLSLPMLEGSMQQTDSSPVRQDGSIEDYGPMSRSQPVDESQNLESSLVHAVKEGFPQGYDTRRGSVHSGLSNSSSLSSDSTGALLRPHYASSGSLEFELESYLLRERDWSTSVPSLGACKRNSASLPCDYSIDYDKSREDSTSSASSYLRANAFFGHRDTLARIERISNTAGSSSTSLALYPSSTISSIQSSLLTRHRDTFARINYKRRPALPVPEAVFKRLLEYLTFQEYKALRLTCRVWLPSLPPPWLPASYRIPGELLQEVYNLLSPVDFDVVRHTCKSWFMASLDRRLLETMSRRAGCYRCTQVDLLVRQRYYDEKRRSMNEYTWTDHGSTEIYDCHQTETDDLVSEEWVYSKRLAIESMLSPDWKGISLNHNTVDLTSVCARMTLVGSVRLSLALQSTPSNAFSVSDCGKYVLVTSGRVVFVCELLRRKPGVQPLTRIVCPRRVLGVSMNTSSKRYAVAVLLEGRVGMCCSLTRGFGDAPAAAATLGEFMQLGMCAEVYGSDSPAAVATRPKVSILPRQGAAVSSSKPGAEFYVSKTSEVSTYPASNTATRSSFDNSWFDDTFSGYYPRAEHADSDEGATIVAGIPVENGPRTVYNNLCSADDPPRSVAICPQRRCVAFGCRMGIELHWVDALTGSDLNRWFPLAAPSDYLYFLPARHSMDSAKKLRLISSAAGQYARQQQRQPKTTSLRGSPPSRQNWRTNQDDNKRQSMTRLFFGNLPFPKGMTINETPGATAQSGSTSPTHAERDHGVLRTVDCDHYRAVPLSDGRHLLFMDPDTGHLCLGSDAPLGGPTKLLRKVVCLPPGVADTGPDLEDSERPGQTLPRPGLLCYTTGQDLRWGVRIAAAYDDGKIMLYCIPRDVFENLRSTRAGIDVWDEKAGLIGQSDLLMDILTQRDPAHGNTSTASQAATEAGTIVEGPTDFLSPRSLALRGIEIGTASGQTVEDIAVSCDFGGLRVWAFMQIGLVRMWTLFRLVNGQEERWVIDEDGVVRNGEETGADNEGVGPTMTAEVSGKKGKGKEGSKSEGKQEEKQHVRFVGSGLDGAADDFIERKGVVGRGCTSKCVAQGKARPEVRRFSVLNISQQARNVVAALRLCVRIVQA